MQTQYFNAINQPENGSRLAGSVIRAGGLVVFPTETVYGLGANGLCGEAVSKIFQAKGRPCDNPLILHVARKSDVKELWKQVPDNARLLMDTFWPGPLTLVYLKSDKIPCEVTAGLSSVAVRMPEHKTALALIRASGVPIAAPSANISGRPSPTCLEHVRHDMDAKVDIIIDGGPCRVGVESTVLSLVGPPTILRPGGITREMLSTVIGDVRLNHSILEPLGQNEVAASPGMKYKHYAPNAEVIVATGDARAAANRICHEYDLRESTGKRCIIFASEQTRSFYHARRCVIIGSRNQPASMCANLFAMLREYDGADTIFAEALETDDMGLAYMNRLLRASGFTTI
ncbi:MAG: L-threonylcarbamoyladenylate synthase [Clostridia bacterium]